MKRPASFFIGLFCTLASLFLALPSFSFAQNPVNQVAISAVVLEHITYYENSGNITVQTNLKNETVVVCQDNVIFVTVKI